MANKSYLDYAGLKRVLKRMLPGARKIWHGTIDEWDTLSAAEKDKYDQAEIVINAVNKMELNNKHPIMDQFVKAKWDEIGWLYTTDRPAYNVPNATWLLDQRLNLTNLPEGTYLMFGFVGFSNVGTVTGNVGIMAFSQQNIQADTRIISTASSSVAIPTGDWYGQTALLGVMINNKTQTVNFGINLYRANVNGATVPLYASVIALKIA